MSEESANYNEISIINTNVMNFSSGLRSYLLRLDLPIDNIVVEVSERQIITWNLPDITKKINNNQRREAYYLSKFITSCCAGLFDAALNYLWNETIENLRLKVVRFDLEYFYDSTLGNAKKRADFKTEEDLSKLDDWEFIRGCGETGIITDIGYKHLNYIRDMRNYSSAAHPNKNPITGFQLLGWLDTCIKEVLAKEPEGPVVTIKLLLQNIRKETLSKNDIPPISKNLRLLPIDLINSLLRTFFGMYNDESLNQNVRNNINFLAKEVWDLSDEKSKKEISLKYAIFSANGELKKKNLAKNFFELVDGLGYIPEELQGVEIGEKLDLLLEAHYGYNNFYTEEPHAKNLLHQLPKTGVIPSNVRYQYVKVLIICKLGNSYGYSHGAEIYYDKMISNFQTEEIRELLNLLNDKDVLTIFEGVNRLNRYRTVIELMKEKTKVSQLIKSLDIILNSSNVEIISKSAYQKIKPLITS
jgi:hypothetical protein